MLRRSWVAPLLIPAIAGTAVAQSTDTAPPPAKQEVVAPNAPPPASTPGQMTATTPGQMDAQGDYTVKSGDTLWDLSQQFLQNPWYWPKIWADNPGVENPHWIYPGAQLHIHRAGPGEPAEVSEAVAEQEEAEAPAAKQELPDFTVGTVKGAGSFATSSDVVSVGGSIPIGLLPSQMLRHIRITSVITDKELDEAGTLTHSFAENEMLGQYDKVYAKFSDLNSVPLGSTYTIFRADEKKVTHPVTNKPFGYQTRLLGTVKIIGKTAKEAICEIGPIIDAIKRGDHLAPYTPLDANVNMTPNDKDLVGAVLVADTEGMAMMGQNHIVYVDKGSADGVKNGNTFIVVETGDGLGSLKLIGERSEEDNTVREDIATLVVFNVSEHSSAALVVKSLREINLGDLVEMRKSLPAGAGGDVR